MSRRLHLEHIWYATLVICLVFSFPINGGANKGGRIFQTQLIVPPEDYRSFRFITSSEYETINFQNAIHSEIDSTSMFNWFLLNKTAYQNYLQHQSYTSILNQTDLRNDVNGFSYDYGGINLPAGEYVFVLEHISGTKNIVIEIIVMLASSDEEMNDLFSSIHPAPLYPTSLPSFLFITISTGGLLGILALKRKSRI
ncbi:MAG: hypothetical protein ACFFDI_24685 [Promethearchaeota archaeon]